MNIKEIAEQLTPEQFEELIARVCIKQALEMDTEEPIDYETIDDNACWIFYHGMNRESGVADKIQSLLLSPEYGHLFDTLHS